jgi:hypothetical protein
MSSVFCALLDEEQLLKKRASAAEKVSRVYRRAMAS